MDFGDLYLQRYIGLNRNFSSEQKELLCFSMAYFWVHKILAATVSPRMFTSALNPRAPYYIACGSALQLVFGRPGKVLALVSEISNIAYDQTIWGPMSELFSRRDNIERRLNELYRPLPQDIEAAEAEEALITETLRLAALLYLHSRIDNAGPQQPYIMQLTDKILSHIHKVPLRTHTILWTLFIVGTLGVRPEADGQRKLVLERLSAFQELRQLGNVRKARQMIEDVWKARDLKKVDATKAWPILTDRHGTISLA